MNFKRRKRRTGLGWEQKTHLTTLYPQSRALGGLLAKACGLISVFSEFRTQVRNDTYTTLQVQPQNPCSPFGLVLVKWGAEALGHQPLARGQVLRRMLASCLPGQVSASSLKR